jgi:hypothetical protein
MDGQHDAASGQEYDNTDDLIRRNRFMPDLLLTPSGRLALAESADPDAASERPAERASGKGVPSRKSAGIVTQRVRIKGK